MQQIVFNDSKTTHIFCSRVNYVVCFELFSRHFFSKHFFSKHSNAISNAFCCVSNLSGIQLLETLVISVI